METISNATLYSWVYFSNVCMAGTLTTLWCLQWASVREWSVNHLGLYDPVGLSVVDIKKF